MKISHHLHEVSRENDDIGIKTYDYFTNDKNVDRLKDILKSKK